MNNYFNFADPDSIDCTLVVIENNIVTIMLHPFEHGYIEFISTIYVDLLRGWKGVNFTIGSREDLAEVIEAGILDEEELKQHKIFKIMSIDRESAVYYIVAKDAVIVKRPRTKRMIRL